MFGRTFMLFIGSIVAGLLLMEIILRLFVPVRNVGPTFTVYDPIYGKSLKKNFVCERICPEFRFVLTTNSFGHRGREYAGLPNGGVLFIGDSFTEGYGVNDGEEFPALVRNALNQRYGENAIPVINAGVGNTGIGRWVKFLQREGKQYNPQLIVLQLTDNDFDDDVNERLFVLGENDSLVEHDPSAPGLLRHIQSVIEAVPGLSYSYLVGFLRDIQTALAMRDATEHGPQDQHSNDRLTLVLVEKLLDICRNEGWPVLVMTIESKPGRLSKLQEIVRKHGVPLLVPPSKVERPDLYYKVDGHWNAKGHEYAAFMLLDAMATLGFPKLQHLTSSQIQ